MGLQKRISVSGRVADLIFYQLYGKDYVRTMPKKVRQTKATKASAQQFGKAVQISRALREGLSAILRDARERSLMHRVNNVILQALLNSEADQPVNLIDIDGFQFYEECDFSDRFKVPLSVEWKKKSAVVNIPEFVPEKDISSPANTKLVQLNLVVTGCILKSFNSIKHHAISINIPYNSKKIPAQQVTLPFISESASLIIVAASLKNGIKKESEVLYKVDKKWNPAFIAGSIYK